MLNATDGFKAALTSPINEISLKLELMDKDENIIDEITQDVYEESLGNITVNGENEIQRMIELELDNFDGDYTWGENNLIWINKRIKLYVGLKVSGAFEYIPQGVFVVANPESSSSYEGSYSTKLIGYDKTYLFTGNLNKFANTTTVTTGTKIRNAIEIILTNSGETKYILDSCDIEVPYDITWQPGESRWQAMKQLADLALYKIYYDVNGYFRFKPQPDITTFPTVWTYNKTDNNTLYAGSIRKLDDVELYNHVIVLGGSGQTAVVRSEIKVDNTLPEWANSPFVIQEIGDRLFLWNDGNPDPLITTQSQANARANFEIKKRLAYYERVSLNFQQNFLHEAYDIIGVEDNKNGTTGKFELLKFDIPIDFSNLAQAEAYRIRSGV